MTDLSRRRFLTGLIAGIGAGVGRWRQRGSAVSSSGPIAAHPTTTTSTADNNITIINDHRTGDHRPGDHPDDVYDDVNTTTTPHRR